MNHAAAHKVFISHGKADAWVAQQLARCAGDAGAATFLDESDVAKGDNFKEIIQKELAACNELLALFTPWSASRFWVWTEIGAAWGRGKRVVGVLHGLSGSDLEDIGGSKGCFDDLNVIDLNDVSSYFLELADRINEQTKA